MKGRLPRIIPPPDEAMAILNNIRPSDPAPRDFVFKGAADGGRINHQAMRLLRLLLNKMRLAAKGNHRESLGVHQPACFSCQGNSSSAGDRG